MGRKSPKGMERSMEFIEVVKPGMLTTVQDLGRTTYQMYGIAACGAMDKQALRLANTLVGNAGSEAGLEITLTGPDLKFLNDGIIAIAGADLSPKLNEASIALWRSHAVRRGDRLTFGPSRDGCCRAYLAVKGGVEVPVVMGSKSTFLRGEFGGVEGRQLKPGDVLAVGNRGRTALQFRQRILSRDSVPDYRTDRPIRFIAGPQADIFERSALRSFASGAYRIASASDRMGYRLEGEALKHRDGPDIISDYIAVGSIQVPGSGQPIVMMADCQMTGGFAKIGCVITADLPYLAQKKPGDEIRFQQIGIEQAHAALLRQERELSLLQINNV